MGGGRAFPSDQGCTAAFVRVVGWGCGGGVTEPLSRSHARQTEKQKLDSSMISFWSKLRLNIPLRVHPQAPAGEGGIRSSQPTLCCAIRVGMVTFGLFGIVNCSSWFPLGVRGGLTRAVDRREPQRGQSVAIGGSDLGDSCTFDLRPRATLASARAN